MRNSIDRRAFLGAAALGVTAAQLGGLRFAGAQALSGTPNDMMRPFQVNVSDATLGQARPQREVAPAARRLSAAALAHNWPTY